MRSALPFRLKIRLPTSRLARVAYAALIVTSVSLVSIFHGKPRVWTVDEVPVAFWAWRTQSPDESDIRAAIEKARAQVVFLRAGQIDYQDGKLRRIRPLAGSLPRGIKLHLVYNTTRAVLEQLESIDPQTLATEFARDYREDSERARRDGADIRGLQLDIDFPTRLLSRYERTLNALRKEVQQGAELSITGLPTWMESPVLNEVLKNVDFWVPQFYGAEIPKHSNQIIPISSPQSISYFVNKAREIDKPFYAGLAAYSVALLYSASGSLISLRGDMNPALIASDPNLELTNQRSFDSGERRYAFRAKADGVTDGLNMRADDVLVIDLPAAETLRIAARITRELAGTKLLGICVFRLPARDDPATLTVEQVTAALNDRNLEANIEVRIKAESQVGKKQFESGASPNSMNTRKWILECKNSGTTSPIVGSLIVDLSVPAGSFVAITPQPRVSIQPMCVTGPTTGPQPCSERRATLLRVTTQFLSPGQTLSASLVLNRAVSGTTNASITMQTDTDQTYSVQREVSIEAGVMNHRFHVYTFRASTRTLAGALLFLAALTATALGCGWIGTSDSIRFNAYQSERDMGRLPPLPNLAGGMNTLRTIRESEDLNGLEESDFTRGEERSQAVDKIWEHADALEKEGQLTQERDLLLEYLRYTSVQRDIWFTPADREHRRNAAFDKLDALTALERGAPVSRVQSYLTARTLQDQDKPSDEVEQVLKQAASDINLKDNVAYLRAAFLYREEVFEEAAQAFGAISRKYPHSEKREAALFMYAIATMKTSIAYTPTSGDEAHLHEGEDEKRHEVITDDAWHTALAGFKRVLAEYPRGRFFNDARGWIAYLMLRKGDRAEALVGYYRLLSDQSDENARIEAAASLELVRHHAPEDELSRVEAELADEPQVALTYAYHSIFNYSIDPGSVDLDIESVNDANGVYDPKATMSLYDRRLAELNKGRTATGRQTVERVLAFSRRLMDRYPSLAIGGAFAVRAAEASVELDKNDDAVRFAQRALHGGVQNNERAQALWIIGVAEHRQKHFDSSRKNLETLIRDYPKSDLSDGARRMVAMVAEDSGDLDTALGQYIAIGYTVDVAYFVDTLMTIEQLSQFIDRHPNLPETNKFTYSLGLRFLRAGRWNEARATFAEVQAVPNPNASTYSTGCLEPNPTRACFDPKEAQWADEADEPAITHLLLMRDIQTINDLERLEEAVKRAPDNEATAEALYQLASYQYEASSLLFYNPVLWEDGRYWNLSYLAVEGRYRTTSEPQLLFAYMQEHDTLARALKIYLQIVEHYPHTRAARDALYTAAVCHERLSSYNPYWRDLYSAGVHAGVRLVTYADVKAAYPTYQLPRGTYGWQPATRTVNGGPGWAAPPKYVPPPSRSARVKSAAENFFYKAWVFWNEKVRRWITMIFLLFSLAFTARIAAQNRKLLRPKLARVRLAATIPTVDPPWTTLFWKRRLELGLHDKLKQFLCERGTEFWELARDGTSRPILLRNILSHSFLAGLVISLFWFLHFG